MLGMLLQELKYRWFWFSSLTQAKPYVEPILKNKKKELIKAKMTVLWKLLQNQQFYCAASNWRDYGKCC
jgi:hypothetical protein